MKDLQQKSILIPFIVGSSYLTFISYFLSVQKIPSNVRNYSYEDYTLVAPLYLGVMAMIGRTLFGYNVWSYFLSGLLSGLIVAIYARCTNSYNFDTKEEWNKYMLYIILKHMFVHGIVIQLIERVI
jgi:fructose-specific phosphotransferase system IIC component